MKLNKLSPAWMRSLLGSVLALAISSFADAQVTVTTDWSATANTANAQQYGINSWSGMDPATAQNATYKSRIADINPGFLRFHAAEQIAPGNAKSWLATNGTSWDSNRVLSVINNVTTGGDRMITITGWPQAWDNGSGRLQTARYTDYANFCASLVQIIKNSGQYIKYWEPFNEKNDPYNGSGAELGIIFKQCRAAMKAVDSTIQVGGPAWTQPYDNINFDACLTEIGGNIDFVSYHQYGTFQATNDIQSLYNGAGGFGTGANNVRNKLNFYGQSGKPLFLGEYNMFSDYTLDYAGLMRSEKSAVYDALALRAIVQTGKSDWATSWNDADNTFGKLDPSFNLRPSAFFLRLARQKLVGTNVSSVSSNDGSVVGFAIKNGNMRSVLLICRSDSNQTTNLAFASNWAPGNNSYTVHTISSQGYSTAGGTWSGSPQGIFLAAHSLKLYEFSGDAAAGGGAPLGQTIAFQSPAAGNSYIKNDSSSNFLVANSGSAGNSEQFKIVDAGGGKVALQSLLNNRYVSVDNSRSDKQLVASFASGIGDWEKFSWIDRGNQKFALLSNITGKYVTANLNGGSLLQADGATSIQYWEEFQYSAGGGVVNPPTGTNGITSGTIYKVTCKASGKVLDVAGVSTADGANVQQYTYGGGNNQKWKVEDVGGGYYKITAQHSGKVLDVAGSSTADGGNVQQYTDNGSDAQRWKIEGQGNGYCKVTAKNSGKVLDVSGSSTADGANVQQWSDNGSDAQRWKFE